MTWLIYMSYSSGGEQYLCWFYNFNNKTKDGQLFIIVIIMIILLPIIDIVYFSLTSENRTPQLSHNNHDSQRNIC